MIGLDGEYISDMVIHETKIYCATSNGLFASTNNGTIWFLTSFHLFSRALTVLGNTVFVSAANQGVYLSNNNGASWSLSSPLYGDVYALSTIGNDVYAGAYYNGVCVTTNNGLTWEERYLYNHCMQSMVKSGNNIVGIIYDDFSMYSGVYISSNNGDVWTKIEPFYGYLWKLAVTSDKVFMSTGTGIYSSTNHGIN